MPEPATQAGLRHSPIGFNLDTDPLTEMLCMVLALFSAPVVWQTLLRMVI